MTTWMLDELAHAGQEHLDDAYVAGYEAKAGYDPGPDVQVLVDLGLDGSSTVVDLGAGTGVFARAVAARAGRVVAVDVSPAMVDVLRRRTAGLANVEVVHAGFLSYEHAGPAPDFVFTRNALHQIPDFWKGIALARIAALLRPGGHVRLHDLVFDFEPADAADGHRRVGRRRRRRPGARLDGRRARGARPPRAQHVLLAVRAAAAADRLRDPRRPVPAWGLRRVHAAAATPANHSARVSVADVTAVRR